MTTMQEFETQVIRVRIGFGKSTLSSRTEVDEVDHARPNSARHLTIQLCLKPTSEKTPEVMLQAQLECISASLVTGEK